MDFVILKINGEDLSSASHDQVLNVFKTASDPIIVEVARRNHRSSQVQKASSQSDHKMTELLNSSIDFVNPYATTDISQCDSPMLNQHSHGDLNIASEHRSFTLQSGIPGTNFIELPKINGIVEEEEDEDEEKVEIIKEEVILRKVHPREIFGLTLSYSALAANDNSESEVYISAIESDSVASKHSCIRVGDQILQINNIDVHSKSQVVALFQGCGLEVRMLLGRSAIIKNKDFIEKDPVQDCDRPAVDEAEYSSVYDEVDSSKEKNAAFQQLDKDSGLGRGTDETTKTEESSECDSSQTSLRKSSQFSSLDSAQGHVDMQQISLLMQQLALEYHQLQRLLHRPPDSPSPLIQALPPPSLNQTSSRVVPRMGTKLEPTQPKLPNLAPSGGTHSSGLDNVRSPPLTMELGPTCNSASLLSLKFDHLPNGALPTYLNEHYDILSTLDMKQRSCSSSDRKSVNSSSAPDMLDPRMTMSSILDHSGILDNECHYYDVYDPSPISSVNGRSDLDAPHLSSHANAYVEHEYVNASFLGSDRGDSKMEWVVKKRPDGTRYITRRPMRNKMLRDRSKIVFEERCMLTTEEEVSSLDVRMNKYLCKSDKKKHQDRSKDKRHRKNECVSSLISDPASNSPSLSRTNMKLVNRFALGDLKSRHFEDQKLYDRPTFMVGTTMF